MKRNVVKIRDLRKKENTTHTIESASIYPEEETFDELTLAQLENVCGGMSNKTFSVWRSALVNDLALINESR